MPRVFVPSEIITSDEPRLTGDKAKRLVRVLRLDAGDTFIAIDDRQQEHTCRILSASPKNVHFEVEATRPLTTEPRVELTVAQAIPKGTRMDFVIQKCVELGARRIIPLVTSRGMVRPDDEIDDEYEEGNRERRWGLIATSAAEQCGRGIVPEMTRPLSLGQALSAMTECDCIFLLDENEREMSLRRAMEEAREKNRLAVIIGPEGGFTPSEIDHAISFGAQLVTLGPRILRAETAGIVAAALIMALAGELEFR